MPRILSTLLTDLRSLLSAPPQYSPAQATATETFEASIDRLVRAIDRSLCLARAAGSASARDAHVGIARLNFNSLRALTSGFRRGSTPDVGRLVHAFTQPDPWNFADLRVERQILPQ